MWSDPSHILQCAELSRVIVSGGRLCRTPRASRSFASSSIQAPMAADHVVSEYKESYSLWLCPKGSVAQKLKKEILTLSASHPGSPVFEPHVTLLPDIHLSGEEVVAKAKELAGILKVCQGSFYFVCMIQAFL